MASAIPRVAHRLELRSAFGVICEQDYVPSVGHGHCA